MTREGFVEGDGKVLLDGAKERMPGLDSGREHLECPAVELPQQLGRLLEPLRFIVLSPGSFVGDTFTPW